MSMQAHAVTVQTKSHILFVHVLAFLCLDNVNKNQKSGHLLCGDVITKGSVKGIT